MTEPDVVPHRFEVTLEVPGTPEQVWQAIATAEGISSWMLPTELEEWEGGAVAFHMGPGASSFGKVTGWEPGRRLEYEEYWDALTGNEGADVTPLATEFLIEATSGGTCVVRVVTSAFGTGADWEHEFWADMDRGWAPVLQNLRTYLTHFPGQTGTMLEAAAEVAGSAASVMAALQRRLGAGNVGDAFEARDMKGEVERVGDEHLALRVVAPVPGLASFFTWPAEGGMTSVRLAAHLYSEQAAAYVEREQAGWVEWLCGIGADDATPAEGARA